MTEQSVETRNHHLTRLEGFFTGRSSLGGPELLGRIESTWRASRLYQAPEPIQSHMVKVAAAALSISHRLHLFPQASLHAVAAALLHDVKKPEQIGLIKSNPPDLMQKIHDLSQEQIAFLLEQGWMWRIAEAAEAAGHGILTRFLHQQARNTICDIEKVVFYADLVTGNPHYLTLEERIRSARERYVRIDVEGPAFYGLPDRTYAVLLQVAQNVEASFARRAGLTPVDFYRAVVMDALATLNHPRE